MTQLETPAGAAPLAQPRVRYRGRHLPMVAVVLAATIATALAYSGMVLFGLEVAHMTRPEAFALAGFLEVSLVAVALMARNAALEGRPYGVLLLLTWILSGTSGMFAALHQVAVPDANTPYMVAFRFVPPLVAALMWHLALVGERHLVTGHTLEERRREHRVHQYVTSLELWRDARVDSAGDVGGMRKVRAAHRRQRAARDNALRLLTVEDFEGRMQVWVERLEAAEKHGSRLDLIGASSAKRGVGRGVDAPHAVAALAPLRDVVAAAGTALSPGGVGAPAAAIAADDVDRSADVEHADRSADADAAGAEPVTTEPFAEALQEALDIAPQSADDADPAASAAPTRTAGATPTADAEPVAEPAPSAPELAAAPAEPPAAPAEPAPATRSAEPAGAADLVGTREPLPETGHTRRVELFDRLGSVDTATDRRSAFFVSHQPARPARD